MKRVLCVFFILLLCFNLPAAAKEGTVTYSGDSGAFIFTPGSTQSPTDLFPELKDVMPGDTLLQKITVKNAASKEVKVKIYLRALGAQAGSEGFLSQLGLKVQAATDNTMAYMFDAAASETAQLSDWVCLGTLYSGGVVNLEVLLEVPVTLGNAYSGQTGYLDWEFKVEEFPVENDDPVPPTGDRFNRPLWLAILAGAGFVLLLLFILRKRRETA